MSDRSGPFKPVKNLCSLGGGRRQWDLTIFAVDVGSLFKKDQDDEGSNLSEGSNLKGRSKQT